MGEQDVDPGPTGHGPSRRTVLAGVAATLAPPVVVGGGRATAAEPSRVSGDRPMLAAMHVHASFSEKQGSWQGQTWRMQQEGVDLLFMTDHSHGLMAVGMAADLTGVDLAPTSTGTLRTAISTVTTTGGLRLAAESAGAGPAGCGVWAPDRSVANQRAIRTSVMGQVLRHRFGAVAVDPGGLYEVRVGLSHHPATAGRPMGVYGLCFRFGPGLRAASFLEDGGLTAVVQAPLPPSGTTVGLDLALATGSAWPDLPAEDHGSQWLSFVTVSPRRGVVARVDVQGVVLDRAPRTAASVGAVQQALAARYSADYGVAVVPSVELGDSAHHNAYTTAPYAAADEALSFTDPDAYTRATVADVHARGGLVSWNHPYGVGQGPALTGSQATARRHQVTQALVATDVWGADVLEVGYRLRGSMGIEDHLALWDTFSRRGRFLTGNGVSDSHDSSRERLTDANEFATGIWAPSTALGDVLPALAAGRVFTRHVGNWPDGDLDLVVDGTYRMGQVVIGGPAHRTLTVTATALPRGAVVEVVAGAVDGQGIDPGTSVVARLPDTAFAAGGVVDQPLRVTGAAFVRLQVRRGSGAVIGVGNPVWLLPTAPAGGVPPPRRT